MDDMIYSLLEEQRRKTELAEIASCNQKTEEWFGLTLSPDDAQELVICRNQSLKKYQRVEFGTGILKQLIDTFCDSQYLNQANYKETLQALQDIFYRFKNESMDKLTDGELMEFMKEQFEGVCYGDLEYLEGTCLVRFAAAIRAGYTGYQGSGGKNEYGQLSEEMRWDSELYYNTLKELFWE